MLVAETYLGHRDDESVAARLADAADTHRVVLSDVERRRSRVRTETAAGRDLGIVVAEELDDGAVVETRDGDSVVVELEPVDALVLEFGDADVSATTALSVGHALGNRHWDLAVEGSRALFPVADSRERTDEAVAGLVPPGVTTRYERVSPATFDGSGPDHTHGDDAGTHAHPDHGGHDHDHDGDAHSHGGPIRPPGGSARPGEGE